MAMDSHDDNQYKLHIDTVNNNRKNSSVSDHRPTKVECSPFSSLVADTSSGSSRRKCAFVSKGITIEEFLETAENGSQLTAIDKLILKNKAALVEDQMKRTRVKPKETPPPASQKGNEKKAKAKVLCSKVAAARQKHQNGTKEPTNATKGTKNSNLKPRAPSSKEPQQTAKKPKSAPSVLKSEKRDARAAQNDSNCRKPKKSEDVRAAQNNSSRRMPKKLEGGTKPKQQNGHPNRKTLLGGIRSLKKEPKVNCKSFDMKRLKMNVPYRTRSGNKEKLRNGKTRIYKDATEALSMERRRKQRPVDSNGRGSLAPSPPNGRTLTKRPAVKQEPLDDDLGVPKKRKLTTDSTAPVSEKNNNEEKAMETPAPASADATQLPAIPMDLDAVSKVEISENVKLEIELAVKEEVVAEPEPDNSKAIALNSNVVEINVNMNIVPNCPEPEEEFSLVCEPLGETMKSESSAVVEDVPVPNGLVLQDFCQLRDYESINLKSTVEENEVMVLSPSSTEDDTSGSINLQLDERSCDSVESMSAESVGDQPAVMPTEPINEREKEERRVSTDDSAKESMFNALGLQSIDKIYQRPKEKEIKEKDNYTGTLKAVIKTDKGCRRMEMKQKDSSVSESVRNESILSFYSKTIPNQNGADFCEDKALLHCSSADNSNDSMSPLFVEDDADKEEAKKGTSHEHSFINMISETFLTEEGGKNPPEEAKDKIKVIATQPLVVPEKSSSFSIHPNRLCSDVCKYCFGKFGSLDTPCHVGQLKNSERRRNILLCEPNLKMDTCLCDACFRYVDRRANRPSMSIKRKTMRKGSRAQRTIICAVQNCNQIASRHYGKRKWRSKISRKIANLSFDVRRGSGMTWGLCTQHYCVLDMYTSCGICKKRLNRNDMYSIQSELNDLNNILNQDGIPAKLVDNMLLCKYCHHCMSLRLKYGDPSLMSPSNRDYYKSFRKEILRCHNVIVSDSEDTNSSEGLKSESCDASSPERLNGKLELVNGTHDITDAKLANSAAIGKKNHNVGIREIASLLKPLEGDHANDKNSTRIQLKFGNLNIGKLSNLNIGQNAQPQPQPEAKHDKPSGEKELPLIADFSFDTADATSKNWERCVSTIQFDKGTKKLWQDLQKPYGNQSSFIRHLIMLEKYWRNGALVLSDTADTGAVKYINSVKNRIESLETSQAPKPPVVPPSKPVYTTAPLVLKSTPPPLQPAPKLTNGPAETCVRHPSAPPPLLKLNCAPFAARKPTPVCAVKPSSDANLQTAKSTLPAPPQLEKIPNPRPYVGSKVVPVTLREYKEMMQSLPRPKLAASVPLFGPMRGVPFMKKPPMTNGNAVVRTVSPNYSIKAFAKSPHVSQSNTSSMLIPKLPKALTVTQIDERGAIQERTATKQPLVAAPFMVGEKPSVTVFREMSK